MAATICLLTCACLAAQPGERLEWVLVPRLDRGQELVYKGLFSEDDQSQGVNFTRSYRLENRLFVLETGSAGSLVAFYTTLRLRTLPPQPAADGPPSSWRLEL